MNKKVYVAMSADILHIGHLNIIKEASKYGDVTVGVLTDKAIASYKRLPFLSYETRSKTVESIKGVQNVISQDTLDYTENLLKLKPDYVVHGDDWKTGVQSAVREKVINIINNWGGELIEPSYTEGISSTMLNETLKEIGTTPSLRLSKLRRLINAKPIVRILESHSGLTGLIIEKTSHLNEKGINEEFDGMWSSSLTDSTSKGKPDIEQVDLTTRLQGINDMLECTTKPMIYDGDTGGKPEHFQFTVRTLERLGISAIIVEDKKGLKKNSLFGTSVPQTRETIEDFCHKIQMGKSAQITEDFMVIARIESFILGDTLEDANTGALQSLSGNTLNTTPNEFSFVVNANQVAAAFNAIIEEIMCRIGPVIADGNLNVFNGTQILEEGIDYLYDDLYKILKFYDVEPFNICTNMLNNNAQITLRWGKPKINVQ